MLDRFGARLVLDKYRHPSVEPPGENGVPNLSDPATGGILLSILDDEGLLTDVVRDLGGWVVAIKQGDGVQGYLADTLGEAAAWALLAAWGEDLDYGHGVEVA